MTTFRRGRSRTSTSRRSFRPQTDWASGNVQLVPTLTPSIVSTAVYNLTEAADPEFFERPPETIRRLRGVYSVGIMPTSAMSTLLVALAVGVAPFEAIQAGPGALPNALQDASWDGWLWHQFVYLAPPSAQLTEYVPSTIDSRAQRRLEDNCLFVSGAALGVGHVDPEQINMQIAVRWLLSQSSRA